MSLWVVAASAPNGETKEWVLLGQNLAKIRASLCVCSEEHFRIFIDNWYCLNVKKEDLGPLPEFLESIRDPLMAYVEGGHQKKDQCDLCGENTIASKTGLFTHFREKHWSGSTVKSAMKA